MAYQTNLGIFKTLTDVASGIWGGGSGGGGGGGGGGSAPGGGAPITVSPAMQQSFTPQFSPVMQQVQDSPGASTAAQPIMTASAPQTASTGMPSAYDPGGYGGPVIPSGAPMPTAYPAFPGSQQGPNYQPIIIAGIIAAAVLGVVMMMQGNKRAPTRTYRRPRTRKGKK